MSDGHLGKCKDCTKSDVRLHRQDSENPREYDRRRYHENKERREHTHGVAKRWAEKYPERRAAQVAVSNAVRDGRIKRQPCENCGEERVHGHHDDYAKPLDVRWLCARCHHRHHAGYADMKQMEMV